MVALKASQGLSEAIKPLQADLFVLRGKTRPKRKQTPLDWEFHFNPFGIAVAVVGGALTLAILQLRVGRHETTHVETKYIDVRLPVDTVLESGLDSQSYALPAGFSWAVPSISTGNEVSFATPQALALFTIGGPLAGIIGLFGLKTVFNVADLTIPPNDVKSEVLYAMKAGEGEVVWGYHVTGHCFKVSTKTVNAIEERKSLVHLV